jgi:hypothetical protein
MKEAVKNEKAVKRMPPLLTIRMRMRMLPETEHGTIRTTTPSSSHPLLPTLATATTTTTTTLLRSIITTKLY